MNFHQHSGDDRELDRLLEQAAWPEPSAEQIDRLRARWRAIVRSRRRQRVGAACAVAATLLVAATIFAVRSVDSQPKPIARQEAADGANGMRADSSSSPPATSIQPTQGNAKLDSAVVESREPNLYERALLARKAVERRKEEPNTPRQEPHATTVEQLVAALANDPRADVEAQLALASRHLARSERRLWEMAASADARQRRGAAIVLSRIGTPRSLNVLMNLTRYPDTHPAAVAGLCRLAAASDLANLASVEVDPPLRREVLAALLERQSQEAVGMYLQFVRSPDHRADALAAAAKVEQPPVDVLVGYLESPQKSTRLAAAQALARLGDVDLPERLSASALGGVGRQEALVALLLSRSAQAASFLSRARADLYLVASIYAAEQEAHSLTLAEQR